MNQSAGVEKLQHAEFLFARHCIDFEFKGSAFVQFHEARVDCATAASFTRLLVRFAQLNAHLLQLVLLLLHLASVYVVLLAIQLRSLSRTATRVSVQRKQEVLAQSLGERLLTLIRFHLYME